jgi:putative sugar O-methyltransferase
MLQDIASGGEHGSRQALAGLLARLRDSRPYKNYELTRERMFDMKDRASRAAGSDVPSKYWTFELGHFDYMVDASPIVIDKLRHHCYHLTGVRAYETHRAAKHEQLESFYTKIDMLCALGSRSLLVPESPILGGFGYDVDGGMVNVDTLKFFEVSLALERAGVIERLRRVDRPIVCEIGPGWGGFAYAFKRLFPTATMILVDLPESFLFSATYLLTAFPDARTVFWGDPGASEALQSATPPDFLFVSHTELAQVHPPRLDAVINMVSFQEMRADQVRGYVNWAADHRSGCLYSLNRDRSPYNDELGSVRTVMQERFAIREIEMLPWSYSKFVHPKKIAGKTAAKLAEDPEAGLDYRHVVGELRNG